MANLEKGIAMPSTSPKQHKLMAAIVRGWRPTQMKGPSPAVAQEFVSADKAQGKYQGKTGK